MRHLKIATYSPSFFEKLALADRERIHSAVIGWLLSNECTALSKEERSSVLNALFGIRELRVYNSISVRLEWKGIDILWLTGSADGEKECWVLENKIKSSQHGGQLDKYAGIIAEQEEEHSENAHYCFLTLVGEPAKSGRVSYHNTTYAKLVDLLEPYFKEEQARTETNSDWLIAYEYFKTIQRMVQLTQGFLNDHQRFGWVFLPPNQRKKYKENYAFGHVDRYIVERGLEKLMQQYYFYNVMEVVLKDLEHCGIKRWHVGETRGNADMAIHFEEYPEWRYADDTKKTWYWVYNDEPEIPYQFDISFQNGTFKFAVSDRYWSKESWDGHQHALRSQASVDEFVKLWKPIFKDLPGSEKMTFNGPQEKGRARVSLSYSIEPKKGEETWYTRGKDDFVKLVKAEFEKAVELRRLAIEAYLKDERNKAHVASWKKENQENIKRQER